MPEGDTIFRAARTLHRALAGRTVTRFDSAYPALTRVEVDQSITGRTVDAVSSRGKHLLVSFSGGLVLRTHMRMNGSWHIYKRGEPWQRPARDMRVLIETDVYVAVGFNIPDAEFLTPRELARSRPLQTLGPDLAQPDFDRAEFFRRVRQHDAEPIEDVLLNQRVVAGIGNVLKSETLFVARIHPAARAGSLDDRALERLLDAALRLMKMNVVESDALPLVPGRRTTGALDPAAKLYVYGRAGKACRRCGTRIEISRKGTDARLTYWCPRCQPERRARGDSPPRGDAT
ncbi:MAG TPA: DNA-formamidopyrimidine glycosylase family protein [Vicinamibacterales bacterium]